MKKKTIADKFAEKTFYSNNVQKSWAVHEAAFGPILTPAFVDDYQAKVAVCAALNLISAQKLKEALTKVEFIKKFIETDEDKALWLFMMGLIFEFAGAHDEMIQCYYECNSFNHNFYLPYLKIAKDATNTSLDVACESYEKAISCLLKQDVSHIGIKNILASTYTNYASACIMKHEYEYAKELLDKSMEMMPTLDGRDCTLAIYYAVTNNKDKAIETIEKASHFPTYQATKSIINEIFDHKHFQFDAFEIEDKDIDDFWKWFIENETDLIQHLKQQNNDLVIEKINEQLSNVFCCLDRDLEFGILIEGDTYQLEFCDNYAETLTKGYEKIIQKSPNLKQWKFKIIH